MKKMLVWMLLLGAAASAGGINREVRASDLPDGLYYLARRWWSSGRTMQCSARWTAAVLRNVLTHGREIIGRMCRIFWTMDSMGTESEADDEILVVWQCVDEN